MNAAKFGFEKDKFFEWAVFPEWFGFVFAAGVWSCTFLSLLSVLRAFFFSFE